MARFTGYKCDVCSRGGEAPEKGGLPAGWMQVILPVSAEEVRPEDRSRDICSGKCLQEFGRQRREVDEPNRVKRASGRATGSTMNPALIEFLDKCGVTPYQRGAFSKAHKEKHKTRTDPACAFCLYEKQTGQAVA